jgi:hypothetical protein
MHPFALLLDMVSPSPRANAEMSSTQRSLVAVVGFLGSLGLAAVWGVAAGTYPGHWALANAFKVPTLLTVSSLAALPLGLLVWKLTAPEGRASDLIVGHASAAFAGSLVLAFLAPLVALYQHSSTWAGPVVAFASAAIALVVGLAIFVRVIGKLVSAGSARRGLVAPAGLLLAVQLAALMQLASLTTPIFPDRTMFGRGIDGALTPSAEPVR